MELASEDILWLKGVVVLVWLAVIFLAERLRPAAQPQIKAGDEAEGGLPRLGRNLGLWGINVVLAPLIVLPLTAWAEGQGLPWRPDWWQGWWQGWGGLFLDLLILDAFIYWWHRANHRLPVLWRFHQVHHLDRFLDSTTSLRFHFGEVMISACVRAGFVILLGLPFTSVVIYEGLLLVATVFHHSNLRLPPALERALSWVVVTPSIHWVHHHAKRSDTDSNYATVLSVWDKLFGSRSPTPRSLTMEIGVEGGRELGFVKLLLKPFRP